MEKNKVSKYFYDNKEIEFHYTNKLSLSEIGGIVTSVANDVLYSDGVLDYRPFFKDYFTHIYLLNTCTDILDKVVNTEIEENMDDLIYVDIDEYEYFIELIWNKVHVLLDIDFEKIEDWINDVIEVKKQAYFNHSIADDFFALAYNVLNGANETIKSLTPEKINELIGLKKVFDNLDKKQATNLLVAGITQDHKKKNNKKKNINVENDDTNSHELSETKTEEIK